MTKTYTARTGEQYRVNGIRLWAVERTDTPGTPVSDPMPMVSARLHAKAWNEAEAAPVEVPADDDTMGYCRTCRTAKLETAFPTLSAARAPFPGARDWDECRACKAERRIARQSADFIHADVQALIDLARSHGFEVEVNPADRTVFLAIYRVPRGGEAKTMLDVVNGADNMFLTFRRLSGGLVSGMRCSFGRSRRVKDIRDAFSTVRVWAI